jgi:hypothetical protein
VKIRHNLYLVSSARRDLIPRPTLINSARFSKVSPFSNRQRQRSTFPNATSRSLTGFQCVLRTKLKALNAERLVGMLASDALELIYLHLSSMRNFDDLARKIAVAAAA